MLQRRSLLAATAFGLAAPHLAGAQGRTEIHYWYGLAGPLGERVAEQVKRFNESQDRYTVVGSFKGSYIDTMTGAIAAWRAGNPPHIAQVFEVGTATMMAAGPAIRPVHQLLAEAGVELDPARYIPGVRGYYSDTQGRLISMPYNSSSAIMWLNLDAFEKAGLSTTDLPKTWKQVRAAAEKIKAANAAPVAITTTWPTWILFEQMAAIHDVPFSTKSNGFEGLDTELQITSPFFRKNLDFILALQKDGLFRYGGRDNAADGVFPSGEAAISFNSAGNRARVEREARFKWISVPLPYHDDVIQAPKNGVIGGASLWALSGRNRPVNEYRGVAEFFRFISEVDMDLWWHKNTGYVPITLAAYEKAKAEGYYQQNPGADAAVIQLSRAEPTPNSKGFRLGNFVEVRNIIQEELEKALQGQQGAQAALEAANRRGNVALRNFERANRG
ncbi:sn-glycerol-3-phosphate ABC transporter substrate-binding protein UgpB [Siccirubricoccus sp. KC 17139]|uniref:sn-glycerol-3-phosphate-binding periplasmic protein UgpB n=1 Tax=Siccirubricoccus soli TaxID=2899147 RepID=A0ABT1CZ34_9PROT|nr:sn-glycerol-3-phosphate ABC transporter substrate-binding protein UgpB [Siccirubricoccus soli]MCO6414924.1 sn-glycerol-3-phosphate ABC transporter substrate-binding protein UgpB [Siccirubricoccus soli]MCP2681054.1 sn-glycerol-3-phosphate ABC transporter substrate-binding protein UgpB [Siccirubricoccus soli]